MLIAPSPTADATRFTFPARASPTANTPGRLVSSICGGRESGHWGLSSCRPVVEIAAGQDEALIVQGQAAAQPLGPRRGAGHHEDVADGVRRFRRPVIRSCQTTRSRRAPPSSCDDLGVEMQLDARVLGQALDQVARHGAGKLAGAHQHVHLARGLRKENRRLSRRVASAHHGDLFPLAQLRLDVGRAVVDPLALELLQVRDARLVVLRSGRDHDRARRQRFSAIEHDLVRAAVAVAAATTLRAIIMLAPNFCAWVVARDASSCPETPVGKPR